MVMSVYTNGYIREITECGVLDVGKVSGLERYV